MNYKVSVVVPVYNAEKTLATCLGNLLNQTLKEIQIILVDDCSADSSPSIEAAAKLQFPDKVKLIQQKTNQGPGAARNAGIQNADGEYIGFVDSDDIVDVTMYEKLYKMAHDTDSDIADCAYVRESSGKASLHFSAGLTGKLSWQQKSTLIAAGGYHATKIFRRKMLLDHNISYRPAYTLEDEDFLVLCIYYAEKVCGTKDILYKYCDANTASLSHEADYEKYYSASTQCLGALYERLGILEHYKDIEEGVEYVMLHLYKDTLIFTLSPKNKINDDSRNMHFTLLQELCHSCIHIPVDKNSFAVDKLSGEDFNLIKKYQPLS